MPATASSAGDNPSPEVRGYAPHQSIALTFSDHSENAKLHWYRLRKRNRRGRRFRKEGSDDPQRSPAIQQFPFGVGRAKPPLLQQQSRPQIRRHWERRPTSAVQ